MTSKEIPNVISSQGSVDGLTLCVSRDGETIGLFGREAAPVSPTASPVKNSDKMTSATSGLLTLTLSNSENLQSSLENKLRERLLIDGGMLSPPTWKASVTPVGRRFCQLQQSARRIDVTDCSLWVPTLTVTGSKGASKIRYRGSSQSHGNLQDVLRSGPTDGQYIHPKFAAWMMGYNTEHLLSAPTETP